MKKILLEELQNKELVLDKAIQIASIYKSHIKPIGELGIKHSGFSIQQKLIEDKMFKDKEISAFFPIYAKLDKFENINDLFFNKDKLDNWDTGVVGYVICEREMLVKDLEFKRISKKKKFSQSRKDEILDYIEDNLLKIKKFYGLNCTVIVENELNERTTIGDIYVKKSFNIEEVYDSVRKAIVSEGLLVNSNIEDDISLYDITLNEDLLNEIKFLKQNFSWTL